LIVISFKSDPDRTGRAGEESEERKLFEDGTTNFPFVIEKKRRREEEKEKNESNLLSLSLFYSNIQTKELKTNKKTKNVSKKREEERRREKREERREKREERRRKVNNQSKSISCATSVFPVFFFFFLKIYYHLFRN